MDRVKARKNMTSKISLIGRFGSGIVAGALALGSLVAAPSTGNIENVGEPINSPLDEFAPSLTADGKTMVFNSKKLGERYQDLFISHFKDGKWTTPEPLARLNSLYNDEAPYITPDGKVLFFASDRDGSKEMPKDESGRIKVSFDIYWSRLENGQWSLPLPVPGEVNTEHHERSPSLDLKTGFLFFARWPFGDFDRSQIMAAKYTNGRFVGTAVLPESINAGYQEAGFTPALERDGFYFSSRRPGGVGGWDVYFVPLTKEGGFGEIEHLGPEVNSEADDIYYSVRDNRGFLSSNREGGLGRYDIYGVPGRAELVFVVKDKKTGKAVAAAAEVERGGEKKNRQAAADGRFTEQAGAERVAVRIRHKGYLPFSETYAGKSGEHVIQLVPIEKDASFDVHAIYFDANEAQLKPESYPVLDELASFLADNAKLKLEIIGHTDLHGDFEYNMDLSRKRADAVREYLTGRGVAGNRLTTKGAGYTRPVIRQKGGDADAKNRRTEFKIIGLE